MPIQHVKSVTIADGTNTNIVRPGDWNSVHAYTLPDGISVGGNTAGTPVLVSSGTLYLYGGSNIVLSQNGNSVSVVGPVLGVFEPFEWNAVNSATTTFGANTLFMLPIMPPAISFENINLIGSVSLPTTSAANTMSVSFTGANSSFGFTANYSVGGTNFVNLYLFSRGDGGSTTDLQTFSSTQLSFGTNQFHTYAASVTNAGSISASLSSSVSVVVSFPSITSGTVTSVNPATTVTTWQPGYTTWTSSTSNSTSSAASSTASASVSLSQTWPATTAWSSNKLICLPFGATLTSGGRYFVGILRASSTSSSSSTNTANVGAGRTYTSSVNASNHTVTGQITYAGFTGSVASSLGFLGVGSTATLGPSPGHGTFSATYSPGSTYMNNAGQANGEIAFSHINTNVSFWKPWIQFAMNRI